MAKKKICIYFIFFNLLTGDDLLEGPDRMSHRCDDPHSWAAAVGVTCTREPQSTCTIL